jgi:hypothetical protein
MLVKASEGVRTLHEAGGGSGGKRLISKADWSGRIGSGWNRAAGRRTARGIHGVFISSCSRSGAVTFLSRGG